MLDLLFPVVFLISYIVLMKYVLPKFGVPT